MTAIGGILLENKDTTAENRVKYPIHVFLAGKLQLAQVAIETVFYQ